jgi:invasion protein IalB
MKHISIFAAAALALTSIAGVAVAQDQEATNQRVVNGARFGSWTVNCEALAVNETVCVLNQRLVRTSDRVFLAELLAFNNSREPGAYLAARVPIGAHFPSGFSIRPGEGEEVLELTWQSCSAELCEALISLDEAKIETLTAAGQSVAGYRPRFGADALVFRIDVTGLKDGLAALSASMDGTSRDVDAEDATTSTDQ